MNNAISIAIQEAMADAALTADALRRFTDLASEVKGLEKKVLGFKNIITEQEYQIKRINSELTDAIESRDKAVAWREALTTREASLTQGEKETAVAKAEARTIKDCFETVFKNTIIRRNLMGTVPSRTGEYSTQENISTQEIIEEE